jgi:hypothetical protein
MVRILNYNIMSASTIDPSPESGDTTNRTRIRIAQSFVSQTSGKSFKSDNELNLHKTLDHQPYSLDHEDNSKKIMIRKGVKKAADR